MAVTDGAMTSLSTSQTIFLQAEEESEHNSINFRDSLKFFQEQLVINGANFPTPSPVGTLRKSGSRTFKEQNSDASGKISRHNDAFDGEIQSTKSCKIAIPTVDTILESVRVLRAIQKSQKERGSNWNLDVTSKSDIEQDFNYTDEWVQVSNINQEGRDENESNNKNEVEIQAANSKNISETKENSSPEISNSSIEDVIHSSNISIITAYSNNLNEICSFWPSSTLENNTIINTVHKIHETSFSTELQDTNSKQSIYDNNRESIETERLVNSHLVRENSEEKSKNYDLTEDADNFNKSTLLDEASSENFTLLESRDSNEESNSIETCSTPDSLQAICKDLINCINDKNSHSGEISKEQTFTNGMLKIETYEDTDSSKHNFLLNESLWKESCSPNDSNSAKIEHNDSDSGIGTQRSASSLSANNPCHMQKDSWSDTCSSQYASAECSPYHSLNSVFESSLGLNSAPGEAKEVENNDIPEHEIPELDDEQKDFQENINEKCHELQKILEASEQTECESENVIAEFQIFETRFHVENRVTEQLLEPSFSELERTEQLPKPSFSELEKTEQLPKPSFGELEKTEQLPKPSFSELEKTEQLPKPSCSELEKTEQLPKPSFSELEKTEQLPKPSFSELEKTEQLPNPSFSELEKTEQLPKPSFSELEKTEQLQEPSISELVRTEQLPEPFLNELDKAPKEFPKEENDLCVVNQEISRLPEQFDKEKDDALNHYSTDSHDGLNDTGNEFHSQNAELDAEISYCSFVSNYTIEKPAIRLESESSINSDSENCDISPNDLNTVNGHENGSNIEEDVANFEPLSSVCSENDIDDDDLGRSEKFTATSCDLISVVESLYTITESPAYQVIPPEDEPEEKFEETLLVLSRGAFCDNPEEEYLVIIEDSVLHIRKDSQELLSLNMKYGYVSNDTKNILKLDNRMGRSVFIKCDVADIVNLRTKIELHCLKHWQTDCLQLVHYPLKCHQNVIIVDLGSCSTRAGILMDQPTLPSLFFPTICATDKKTGTCIYGMEALQPEVRQHSNLSFPVRPSIKITKHTIDIDLLEGLFKKVFSELKVDPTEYTVLVCMPRNVSNNAQTALVKLLLDNLRVKAVSLTNQALLTLYAHDVSTAVVVDIGDRTDVLPVVDGFIVENGVTRLPHGGQRLVHHMTHGLAEKRITLSNDIDSFIVQYIIENLAYVAENYDEEIEISSRYPDVVKKTITLQPASESKSCKTITLEEARFKIPEGLFNPDLWGLDSPGIHHLVQKAIQATSVDARKRIAENIFVSGGVTMLPGFVERLNKEVAKLSKAKIIPKVYASNYRYHCTYIGACKFAKMEVFPQVCVNLDEFTRNSASALKKCALYF